MARARVPLRPGNSRIRIPSRSGTDMIPAANVYVALRFRHSSLPQLLLKTIGRAGVLLTALVLIIAVTSAQTTAGKHGPLRGTVRDAVGATIPSASISIEENQSHTEMTTSQDGSFTLSKIDADTIKLRVDKPGYCPLVIDVLLVNETKPLDLVLVKSDASGSNCSAQTHGSKLNVELEDKPSFTIAGITDWSGAGGHGSDTTLPTTEKLTQHALAMKSASSKPSCTVD